MHGRAWTRAPSHIAVRRVFRRSTRAVPFFFLSTPPHPIPCSTILYYPAFRDVDRTPEASRECTSVRCGRERPSDEPGCASFGPRPTYTTFSQADCDMGTVTPLAGQAASSTRFLPATSAQLRDVDMLTMHFRRSLRCRDARTWTSAWKQVASCASRSAENSNKKSDPAVPVISNLGLYTALQPPAKRTQDPGASRWTGWATISIAERTIRFSLSSLSTRWLHGLCRPLAPSRPRQARPRPGAFSASRSTRGVGLDATSRTAWPFGFSKFSRPQTQMRPPFPPLALPPLACRRTSNGGACASAAEHGICTLESVSACPGRVGGG